MKKNYETPSVEKINFMYRDQVVAASGSTACHVNWQGYGSWAVTGCTSDKIFHDDTSPF